jgi:phosphoglycerate kinase
MPRSVKDAGDVRGKRVLVRASLDVPIENGGVRNDFRLSRALETVAYLSARGAKVILMGHIGRDATNSMRPVYDTLRARAPLSFVEDVAGERTRAAVAAMQHGGILLIENLRREKGEMENAPAFAVSLASLADMYVNDDFASAHRAHASIVGVPPLLPHYAGLLFMKEYEELSKARAPQSPSLSIIGGAKFLTKEPLIEVSLEKYDRVLVAGALANDFLKAQGHEVGRSLISPVPLPLESLLQNSKLMVPSDVTVLEPDGERAVKPVAQVGPADVIMDIGPATLDALAPLIAKARFILWNGPLGNYEKGFHEMTERLALMIAESGASTIVGGGDTIAVIDRLHLEKKFTFLSTAGGAMLEFIAKGTLPAIEALER